MLNVIEAEFRKNALYSECRYAECRYADCRGACFVTVTSYGRRFFIK
jgi:hypothetical protein